MVAKITNSKQLCTELREIRRSLKLSQTELSKKVGMKQKTVSKFERSPDSTQIETFFKILAALELEIEIKPRNTNPSENKNSSWNEEW